MTDGLRLAMRMLVFILLTVAGMPWAAQAGDVTVAIAATDPPFIDARVFTSLLAKSLSGEASGLVEIEFPSS